MPSKLGSEFQISTYTMGDQSRPVSAVLKNGNVVVAWFSYGQDGSGYGVYAQILSQTGTKIGSEFQVNTYTAGDQGASTSRCGLTDLANGGFVVAWESALQDGSGFGLYGQIFNQNGARIGSEIRLNTYTTGDQVGPFIAGLKNGNFVAVWYSNLQDSSGYGVYAQIFDQNGAKVGSEFRVNTYTLGDQRGARVATLVNGNFVVTWGSFGQDGSDNGIYAQIFDQNGAKMGSEFLVNTYVTNAQNGAKPSSLLNGNFVVVWHSYQQDGSLAGVYAQIFSPSGVKLGPEFGVNTYTLDDQLNGGALVLSNGNFIITWNSNGQDGSGLGVYGQVFTPDGVKIGQEFRINTYTVGQQEQVPSGMIGLGNGNFLSTWSSDGQDGSGLGIYGQIFYGQVVANTLSQSVSYTQDVAQSLPAFNILGALNEDTLTVTLTLSNPIAGQLSTGTSNGVTSSYNTLSGVWQASGKLSDVNSLLAGITFTPATSYNQNFTIQLSVTDGTSSAVSGMIQVTGIPVNAAPKLVNNQLTIAQGQSLVLSTANLSATDADNPVGSLTFVISNLQGGRFELVSNPGIGISTFTQQQVIGSQVRFVQDGSGSVSYRVSVNDGVASSSVLPASISFTLIPTPTPTPTPVSPPTSTASTTTLVSTTSTFTPTPFFSFTPTPIGGNTKPVIINNQLSVTQGGSVVLTSANLSAKDGGVNDHALVFYMDNIQHGHFERLTAPGITITQFTQQEILDQQIRFVVDDSGFSPSYAVIVSDGSLASFPQAAQISFTPTLTLNTAPEVIGKPEDQNVTVEKDFEFAFRTEEIFKDKEGNPLTFSMRRWNETWPSRLDLSWNSTAVTFKGMAATAGAAVVGLLATDTHNATSVSANFTLRAFNPGIPAPVVVNTPGPLLPGEIAGIAAASVVGVLGVAAAAYATFWAKKGRKGCFGPGKCWDQSKYNNTTGTTIPAGLGAPTGQ